MASWETPSSLKATAKPQTRHYNSIYPKNRVKKSSLLGKKLTFRSTSKSEIKLWGKIRFNAPEDTQRLISTKMNNKRTEKNSPKKKVFLIPCEENEELICIFGLVEGLRIGYLSDCPLLDVLVKLLMKIPIDFLKKIPRDTRDQTLN